MPELARIRGIAGMDSSVNTAISWATLKDYEIHIGISLEIAEPIGDASHKIRSGEFTKLLPMIGLRSTPIGNSPNRERKGDPCPKEGQRAFIRFAA
jgi:hypothetical protein